ncbi:MAG: Hsp20/alpha crystallin family protein [Chloroflexi bacterium]|nr:Hsp20/alpha crystallin family protein [Chloroflexota bacterium]
MDDKKGQPDPGALLGGTLNILGLKLDLGELLGSQGGLTERLEELRERLKAAGGRESLSDEDWKHGGARVSGHIRTRGALGDQEYHIGTAGRPPKRAAPTPQPSEPVEPPVDVFDEVGQVTIVADVPGAGIEDLELKVEGRAFSLATGEKARRSYHKELGLPADVEPDSLRATCRNGVLEVRLRKRGTKESGTESSGGQGE